MVRRGKLSFWCYYDGKGDRQATMAERNNKITVREPQVQSEDPLPRTCLKGGKDISKEKNNKTHWCYHAASAPVKIV